MNTQKIELGIEVLEETALKYFIQWFTYKNQEFDKLSQPLKAKMKRVIKNGMKHNKIGELIAAAYLINNNFDIGWSNIHLATPGNAEERGVDLLIKKEGIPYFTEIKTNQSGKMETIRSLISSVLKQVDARIVDVDNQIDFMEDLKWFEDEDKYTETKEWIKENIKGIAFVIAPSYFENLNKNYRHDLYYGILNKETVEEVDKQIKREIDE